MSEFPKGFMWGSSTSSHQIEGENRNNDWWEWEAAGRTEERSGKACDSYSRYREDCDLAKELSHTAYRFSIEWSRVEPEEGRWDPEAIRHYRELLGALRERGIEPVVTLHHFTNPLWLQRRGGWENPAVVGYFLRYSERIVEALGDGVRFWITINEPSIFVYKGYIERTWPPGKRSFLSLVKVFGLMARAHAGAYERIHRVYAKRGWKRPMVSIAHHLMVAEPCRGTSWRDRLAAFSREILNNRLILRFVEHSAWYLPAYFFGLGGRRHTLDFVGVNYYLREVIVSRGSDFLGFLGEVCNEAHPHRNLERNDMNWEIYPEGMYHTLMGLKERYGLPIFITENGIPTADEEKRIRFIRDHLVQILKAIHDGAEVLGYLYWSLLDNFEWSFGYAPRFGLVHVDRKTQDRTIKNSAHLYARLCRENRLEALGKG